MSSSHKHPRNSAESSRGSRDSGRGSAADESQEYPDPNCEICRGTGSYMANVTRIVRDNCSACGGSGHSRTGRARPVYCCTQEGDDDVPSLDCQLCGGSYGYWNPCERCDGSGKHPTRTRTVTVREAVACDCYGNY
jgi:DnaJ-class molecular chaperone